MTVRERSIRSLLDELQMRSIQPVYHCRYPQSVVQNEYVKSNSSLGENSENSGKSMSQNSSAVVMPLKLEVSQKGAAVHLVARMF